MHLKYMKIQILKLLKGGFFFAAIESVAIPSKLDCINENWYRNPPHQNKIKVNQGNSC